MQHSYSVLKLSHEPASDHSKAHHSKAFAACRRDTSVNNQNKFIIKIHPPSGWFFICGHSPLFFAVRRTHWIRSANCVGLLLATRQRVVKILCPHFPSSTTPMPPFTQGSLSQNTSYRYPLLAFSSSAIAAFEPRDYRVVFVLQKGGERLALSAF